MPVTHESTSPAELAACRSAASPCAACTKRARISPIASSPIHAYGSTPRSGWVPRRLVHEPFAPTFGVELETAAPYGDLSDLTGEELAAAAAPRGHWHAMHDGSVSGPELTSQPGSLAYWRSIRPSVASMMRTAIHGGMRSHDAPRGHASPESCSMHCNIGRDGFADAAHLGRFIRLATANPRWTTRLAQRTHDQVRSWANFTRFPDAAACDRLARDWWTNDYAYTGHGSAVNLENPGRVEFRVPRGTLRVDRFYAKLEWVASMVEYTRVASARPTPGAYCDWVVAHRSEYPEIVEMLAELMPARVAA